MTKADYFTLGNLKESFTTVAKSIAVYDEYRNHIIDRLWKVKLRHWDFDVRVLSSQSLHLLAKQDSSYIFKQVLPQLCNSCCDKNFQVRHGAILGVAEIVLDNSSFSSRSEEWSRELESTVVELPAKIEDSRLYRGRGGEQIRAAVCRLIECISLSKLNLSIKQQVSISYLNIFEITFPFSTCHFTNFLFIITYLS